MTANLTATALTTGHRQRGTAVFGLYMGLLEQLDPPSATVIASQKPVI